MLATGCQNLGRLNRKLSEVLWPLEMGRKGPVQSIRHNASAEHKDTVSYLVKLKTASNSQTEQSESRNRARNRAILNTDPI